MPLTEGYLYDAIEIFRGVGNWSAAHSAMGLSVHDGVGANSWMDLGSMSLFRELAALALRRVVRDWHVGMSCLKFGALKGQQVKSNSNVPVSFQS